MNYKPIKSCLLITLTLIGTALVIAGITPGITPILPFVPDAHAAPPNNPAILGLFNEQRKTNAFNDSSIASGGTFIMDVNVTDAGVLKGFDISINFSSSAISVSHVSWCNTANPLLNCFPSGLGCPKAQGCLLDGLSVTVNFNATTSGGNTYRLALIDSDSSAPFLSGTGILFRLTFKTAAASVASSMHIHVSSTIQNPASVNYNAIDGYVDTHSASTVTAFYKLGLGVSSTTLVRPVSSFQTNATTPGIAVTLSNFFGAPGTVTFKALSIPLNSPVPVFSPATCTTSCSSTLTLAIHGGPKGGATTTPTGTYRIPVIGNSTAGGGIFVKVAWLTLIVKAPAPPVYTITSPVTSFTQQLGNWTKFSVSASLVSGSNDSIQLGTDCANVLNGGACLFSPPTPAVQTTAGNLSLTIPFTTSMNVSTQVTTTTLGIHYIHVIGTSAGTYSETPVTMPSETIIAGTLKVDNALTSDPKIKFVNSTNTDTWSPGKTVVYDSNNNGVYDTGEPVIAGTAPAVGTKIKNDPLIKFFDNAPVDGHWDAGKGVGYDANNNGVFDVGLTIAVNVLKTHDLAVGTVSITKAYAYEGVTLSSNPLRVNVTVTNQGTVSENFQVNSTARVVLSSNDCRLAFVDANGNLKYDAGETVVIDTDCNGRYGVGKVDSRITFVDANANGHWDPGETVVLDSGLTRAFDPSGPDKVIAGSAVFGEPLKLDASISFVDLNGNGVWDPGEPVVYNPNHHATYQAGDTVIAGTPTVGQTLKLDTLITFVDTTGTGSWSAGKPVVYDTNNNGVYDPDIVISGTAPASGTVLVFDPKITFVDSELSPNGAWEPGETVFYDNAGNGLYASGDPLIPAPTVGQTLKVDPLIKYVDTNGTNVWTSGKPVVYDTNNDNLYDLGDIVIAGHPTLGAILKSDPLLKYFDTNANNVWNTGEPVAYDTNNNNLYDTSEPIIPVAPTPKPVFVGAAPAIGTTLCCAAQTAQSMSFVDTNFNGVWDPGETIVWDSNLNGLYDSGEPFVLTSTTGRTPSAGVLLAISSVTLAAGATSTFSLSVDPSSLPRGNYLIGGAAIPVPGEFLISNNQALVIAFTQKLRGDWNGDCQVNIQDFSAVGGLFGSKVGDARWDPRADFTNQGTINIIDFSLVGGTFGSKC